LSKIIAAFLAAFSDGTLNGPYDATVSVGKTPPLPGVYRLVRQRSKAVTSVVVAKTNSLSQGKLLCFSC